MSSIFFAEDETREAAGRDPAIGWAGSEERASACAAASEVRHRCYADQFIAVHCAAVARYV
jgi:hypothetical protein